MQPSPVFNLALRMVWRRNVAEDATQEILIKAATKSSTFGGELSIYNYPAVLQFDRSV
jgi:DNA-directed RNA polymerase specialized sigma24 family protein